MSEALPQVIWSLYNYQVSGAYGLPNSSSSHSNIHHIFHVSCLNKAFGTKYHTQTNLPELD
jgi:hypothetical protein